MIITITMAIINLKDDNDNGDNNDDDDEKSTSLPVMSTIGNSTGRAWPQHCLASGHGDNPDLDDDDDDDGGDDDEIVLEVETLCTNLCLPLL